MLILVTSCILDECPFQRFLSVSFFASSSAYASDRHCRMKPILDPDSVNFYTVHTTFRDPTVANIMYYCSRVL